jgi:histidinol-phosphate aminotransferase
VSLLNRIRTPFNVNALAQVAALAAIEDEAHILECRQMIEAGRTYLCGEFTALGVRYTPSRANFILVDVGRNAHDIYQRLLKNGVIVRPMLSFGMESALRISIGTPEENRRLIKALRKVLAEGRSDGGKTVVVHRGGEGKHV